MLPLHTSSHTRALNHITSHSQHTHAHEVIIHTLPPAIFMSANTTDQPEVPPYRFLLCHRAPRTILHRHRGHFVMRSFSHLRFLSPLPSLYPRSYMSSCGRLPAPVPLHAPSAPSALAPTSLLSPPGRGPAGSRRAVAVAQPQRSRDHPPGGLCGGCLLRSSVCSLGRDGTRAVCRELGSSLSAMRVALLRVRAARAATGGFGASPSPADASSIPVATLNLHLCLQMWMAFTGLGFAGC